MTTFWSLAAVMMVVALLFTVPPLLRNRETETTSTDRLNIEVVRTQLDELKADLEAGRLDKAQYAAAREDLENELLYDLSGSETPKRPTRSGRWIAIVVAVTVPLLAVWLYDQLGAVKLIEILQQQAAAPQTAQQAQQPAAAKHNMSDLIEQLSEKLKSDPDSLEGWALLARSYVSQKRHAEAVDAYANVRRLGGDNAQLLADYADAMVTANGGQFDEESGKLLTRAIELDPNHLKALWLAGHWEYSRDNYAAAVRYWEQVAPKLEPDSQNAIVISKQIRDARSRMDGSESVAVAEKSSTDVADVTTQPPAPARAVIVQVELDPGLHDKISPQDTVFVFARATSGPRMPLAVHRRQVSDLPLTVTLDDSTAMTPTMKLSRFEEVTIGALVSRTGVAMPKTGDLQGTVSPVPTSGSDTVQLMIDTVVP